MGLSCNTCCGDEKAEMQTYERVQRPYMKPSKLQQEEQQFYKSVGSYDGSGSSFNPSPSPQKLVQFDEPEIQRSPKARAYTTKAQFLNDTNDRSDYTYNSPAKTFREKVTPNRNLLKSDVHQQEKDKDWFKMRTQSPGRYSQKHIVFPGDFGATPKLDHDQISESRWELKSIISAEENFSQLERKQHQFMDGTMYEGQWKDGCRHGEGIQFWPNGDKYEGYWKNDKQHGEGTFWHANGDVYRGTWKHNMSHGYGRYDYSTGQMYEGQWKFDIHHGKGVEKWADGSQYEGQYSKGKKHGQGTYKWATEGTSYQGEWYENKLHGFGKFYWPDGRTYDGAWSENQMDGYGTYIWPDGRRYEGMYLNDLKHGFGKYYWPDGRRYEGQFAEGKQHGHGKIFSANGRMKEGVWYNGKLDHWINQ